MKYQVGDLVKFKYTNSFEEDSNGLGYVRGIDEDKDKITIEWIYISGWPNRVEEWRTEWHEYDFIKPDGTLEWIQ
jgi:hypothetical protein